MLCYRTINFKFKLCILIIRVGQGNLFLKYLQQKQKRATGFDLDCLIITFDWQKFSLVDRWFVYEGEGGDYCSARRTTRAASKSWPEFCVRKNMNLLNANPNILAHVYREASGSHKRRAYVIEGSYTHRSCKVLDDCSRNVVAEIKRKEANVGGVSYGEEVFHLIVHPGFDPGFAMALVILLDQMF